VYILKSSLGARHLKELKRIQLFEYGNKTYFQYKMHFKNSH